jgi:hypothetical protein
MMPPDGHSISYTPFAPLRTDFTVEIAAEHNLYGYNTSVTEFLRCHVALKKRHGYWFLCNGREKM